MQHAITARIILITDIKVIKFRPNLNLEFTEAVYFTINDVADHSSIDNRIQALYE